MLLCSSKVDALQAEAWFTISQLHHYPLTVTVTQQLQQTFSLRLNVSILLILVWKSNKASEAQNKEINFWKVCVSACRSVYVCECVCVRVCVMQPTATTLCSITVLITSRKTTRVINVGKKRDETKVTVWGHQAYGIVKRVTNIDITFPTVMSGILWHLQCCFQSGHEHWGHRTQNTEAKDITILLCFQNYTARFRIFKNRSVLRKKLNSRYPACPLCLAYSFESEDAWL